MNRTEIASAIPERGVGFTPQEFDAYIFGLLQGSIFPPGRRTQLALASLIIARDHYRAIAMLVDKSLYPSALALCRTLVEAVVKGLWLSHCSREDHLEAFASGRELGALNELTDDLMSTGLPASVRLRLRTIKRRHWKLLSSLTHAGHAQVKRWLSPNGVEPRFETAEIQELVDLAAFMALTAALGMAQLANNSAAFEALEDLLPVVAESPPDGVVGRGR